MWLGFINRRRVLKLHCFYYIIAYIFTLLLILFPKEHHSSSSSSLLSSVSSRFFCFVIFSQKHDCQYTTELPAFQPTTLVFRYKRPPTEMVYALQASIIFVLLKQRLTQTFSSPSSCHFVPKDQNKLRAHFIYHRSSNMNFFIYTSHHHQTPHVKVMMNSIN